MQGTLIGSYGWRCAFLLALASNASWLLGQQPNGPQASLTINGISGPPYPLLSSVSTPGTLSLVMSGSAGSGAPFALFAGPLNPGNAMTPGGQIADIGTPPGYGDVTGLMNGLIPGPLNSLAFLGSGGVANLVFPVPPGLSGGVISTLQGLVFDPTHPDGFAITAATTIAAFPPLNYGTAKYLRGSSASTTQGFLNSNPGPAASWSGIPSSIDIEPMGLAGFQYLISNPGSGSHPYFRRSVASLAPLQAVHVGTNAAFPYNRTLHGDLYCFQDQSTNPNAFGFFLSTPGSAPVLLPATMRTGTGTLGANPVYQPEIGVHGNLMVAVEDREAIDPVAPNQSDRLWLFTLDGTTLPLSGTAGAEITPSSIPLIGIAEESLTLTAGGWLFFMGSPSSPTPSSGLLFQAPMDGTMAATQTMVPPVASALAPPSLIDGELRLSDDRSVVVFQAGTSPTEEDLYVIRNITPAGFLVQNLTQFPVATEIEAFGDASDGLHNQVALSPGNAKVAFITRQAGRDELHVVPTDGSSAPVHVTGPTKFADAIDDVVEPWWADDDNLLFFAGTSTEATDLYRYIVSSSTLVNLTQTNGQIGPPFAATPGATIDPDGVWPSLDRRLLFFLRDGVTPLGVNIFNIVAVDLTTFLLTDVTGGEFSAGTVPDIDQSSATSMEIAYAPVGTHMLFVAEKALGTDDELWSFDAQAPSPAVQLTQHNGATQVVVSGSTPDATGTTVAFASDVLGSENLYLATIGTPGSRQLAYSPPSSSFLTDGGLAWNSQGLHFVFGKTSASNPSDAVLLFLDPGSLVTTVVDPVPGSYFLLDSTFP